MNAPFVSGLRGNVICGDAHFSVVLAGIDAWGLRWSQTTPGAWVMWVNTCAGNVPSIRAVADDFGDLVAVPA